MSDEFRIAAVSYRALHLKFLALENELTAAQKDAERYRYMKSHKGDWYAWSMRTSGSNNLDAAIDAAMKEDGK